MRKEVAHSFVLESAPVAEDIPVPVKFDWSSSKASDVSINVITKIFCDRNSSVSLNKNHNKKTSAEHV
jgi:hypothetical protein